MLDSCFSLHEWENLKVLFSYKYFTTLLPLHAHFPLSFFTKKAGKSEDKIKKKHARSNTYSQA